MSQLLILLQWLESQLAMELKENNGIKKANKWTKNT